MNHELSKSLKVYKTLVACGYPKNKALYIVAHSFGLSKKKLIKLISLV